MKKFFVFAFISGLLLTNAFAVDYDSQFITQSVPLTMYTRQTYNVYIDFKNTGTSPWSAADSIKLGSENPVNNTTWGLGRVNMGSSTISSGGTYRFSFTVTAPEEPGSYNFQWRMLKEYVKWFGDYSPNLLINVVRPDYDAKFITQSVSTSMVIGQYYPVSLTFQNMGTNAWTKAGNIRLGSQSPQDNQNWGMGRVDLAPSDSIATGHSKVFSFSVTPPDDPGNYNFQWRMLKENVKWFGDYSTKKTITVTRPQLGARFISQDVPSVMNAGEQREVRVTFKNLGSETWSGTAGFALGSQNPANNCTWGRERVYLFSDTVAPGATKNFVFTITAPAAVGEYNFQWRMVKENVAWFGNDSKSVKIQVINPVSVSLVTPTFENNVNGIVPVTVNITGNAARTEFYVDGALYDSVSSTLTGQYTFNWNTAFNHLPPLGTGRTMDYAYYGVVGVWLQSGDAGMCDNPDAHPTYYGSYTEYCHSDFSHHVNGYTNAFIASPAVYKPDSLGPGSEGAWQYWLGQDMAAAAGNNKRMELGLLMTSSEEWTIEKQQYVDQILNIAGPYWDHISRIEVTHEPGISGNPYTRVQLVNDFSNVTRMINDRGWALKPLGFTLAVHSAYFDPAYDWFSVPNLDWVGVEAYIPPVCTNLDLNFADLSLYDSVDMDMDRIPEDKNIVLIMMSYTWNGLWTDIDALRDLQIPTYLIAQNDSRVVGINMFAYARKYQGPLFIPELKTPHKLIWEKISGTTLAPPDGPAGNGRRTLEIKVYDANGKRAIARTIVIVNN